jgi:porin
VRASFSALVIVGALILGPASRPVLAQDGFFERETLTGNWGGARKQWQDAGIEPGANDIAETLSNPTGGIRQRTIYQGLLAVSLSLDLEKIADWPGASFYTDAYQISGRGLSRNAIGNLLAVSTIEALPSTRLHDLWLQQQLLDGKASFRLGQIALDDEFYISQYSAIFVNSTFGCPDILSTDLSSGAPPGRGDPQIRNPNGTNFLIGEGGSLVIGEVAYAFDTEPISSLLLSDVKLGGWYHTADFPDLRRDTLGRSLADPVSNGIAASHRGNFGLYLVLDKMLWRRPDTATQGLAAFLRVGEAPSNRNLISLEVDAGLTYKGLFPGRELDLLGVAASYGRIGNAARRLDRDEIQFTGIGGTIRDYEAVLEITYQARIAPWWTLQPDFQLIAHPGGHVAPPLAASSAPPIPNALVLGLRSSILF